MIEIQATGNRRRKQKAKRKNRLLEKLVDSFNKMICGKIVDLDPNTSKTQFVCRHTLSNQRVIKRLYGVFIRKIQFNGL